MNELLINQFLAYYNKNIDTNMIKIPNEYEYKSIALCIVDAVFSINSKYKTTRNVVERTQKYFKINSFHEYTLKNFDSDLCKYDYTKLADHIFMNKQRTSTTNGILKAEAVVRFTKTLLSFGINHMSDLNKMYNNQDLILALKKIPGQKSGISIEYFFMLCGDTSRVKMDRHLTTFIDEALNQILTNEEKVDLLKKSLIHLREKTKIKTLRALDYSIWSYMSNRDEKQTTNIDNNKIERVKDLIDLMNEKEKKNCSNI